MPKKIISPGAAIDSIYQGRATGGLAKRLMANGMQVNGLRTNDTLRKDEWKEMDQAVVEISRTRLVGVNDLVSRGLVYNIGNGLGTTVLEYEDQSDMSDAQINMDAATRGPNDRVEFSINYLPLPIIHKDFQISIRVLEASRKLGQPLDTTQAGIAARKVSEATEKLLFTGTGGVTFGGGTIYGYQNYPNRNQVNLTANWDASGATILDDVRSMKQASIDAKHYGPWGLYVPSNYETVLDDDYSSSYPNVTIRDRILKVGGISFCTVSDYLDDDNVVLVELSPETIRMVIGMQPTTVEWEAEGGMIYHFKVMSIMVPQIRADQDGKCGLVHLS